MPTARKQKVKFSVRFLESLPAREKRYDTYDADTRGLGVTVFESGALSLFWCRKVRGVPKRITIGKFPECSVDAARRDAEQYNVQLADWTRQNFTGANPFEPAPPPAPVAEPLTLKQLFERYVEDHLRLHAKNPARMERGARQMWDDGLADLGSRTLDSLKVADADTIHSKIGRAGKRTSANRTIQLLKTLLRFGQKKELYFGADITKGVELFDEKQRERFLQPEELPAFMKALKTERNRDVADLVTLAIFTAARRADLFGMRWEDISFERASWTIPDPKSRRPYIVPLADEAIAVLKNRKPNTLDSIWVFPHDGTGCGHYTYVDREWDAFRERAQLRDFHFHDLRRSLASWMALNGTSLQIIARSLGHSGTQNTERYARLLDAPVRDGVQHAVKNLLAAGKAKPA